MGQIIKPVATVGLSVRLCAVKVAFLDRFSPKLAQTDVKSPKV